MTNAHITGRAGELFMEQVFLMSGHMPCRAPEGNPGWDMVLANASGRPTVSVKARCTANGGAVKVSASEPYDVLAIVLFQGNGAQDYYVMPRAAWEAAAGTDSKGQRWVNVGTLPTKFAAYRNNLSAVS